MDTMQGLLARINWDIVWTEVQIISASMGIIYAGAHGSLSRPPSAAPRKRRAKDGRLVAHPDDGKKEIEGLRMSDAIIYPFVAAGSLVSLYYLLENYAEMLTKVLRAYLGTMSLASLTYMYSHVLQLYTAVVMPRCWRGRDGLYIVGTAAGKEGTTGKVTGFIRYDETDEARRHVAEMPLGPMPLWSPVALSTATRSWLWNIRPLITKDWTLECVACGIKEQVRFPVQHVFGVVGAVFTVWAYHATNATVASNLMGMGACYSAMRLLSPTSFSIGALFLTGLFVYDIVMVFYTSFMITVATNLDIPIKIAVGSGKAGSILGLGDIVVPGVVIALALRFDLWRHYARQCHETEVQLSEQRKDPSTGEITTVTKMQRKTVKPPYKEATGAWGDWFWIQTWRELLNLRARSSKGIPDHLVGSVFPKTYFHACMFGYAIGMVAAMSMMLVFKQGQPALLYLVPSILISIYGTAWFRGDLKDVWTYTEDGSLDTKDVVVDVEIGPDGKPIKSEAATCKEGEAKASEGKQDGEGASSSAKPGDVLLVRLSVPDIAEDDGF